MNALDKRIGNYIYYYPGFDSPQHKQPRYLAKITNLNESGVYGYEILEKHPDAYHKSIEEIKLTEEWLVKFFEFESDTIFGVHIKYSKDGIEIWHDKKNNTFLLENIKNKKVFLPTVHKLQNVYSDLNDKELTIKEETK